MSKPPITATSIDAFEPMLEDLSEGPWTTLVLSLLACVAVALLAAGTYAGGL